MDFFLKNVEQVVEELNSNMEKGLSEEEVIKRQTIYGENILLTHEKRSIFKLVPDSIKTSVMLIVAVATIFYLFFDQIFIGIGILFSIVVLIVIAIILERKSEKVFKEIELSDKNRDVKVLRGGEVIYVPKSDITIGDIIYFEAGDRIPADGRIIRTLGLKIDESRLTGKREPVLKQSEELVEEVIINPKNNMVYAGTLVLKGRGTAIITSIGYDAEVYKILEDISEKKEHHIDLIQKIVNVGKKVSIVGVLAVAMVLLFKLFIMFKNSSIDFYSIKEMFIVYVVLIVAIIPQYLSAVLKFLLAINVQKMLKHGIFIRDLSKIKAINTANVICCNKTGVLTKTQMTVVNAWNNGNEVDIGKINNFEMIQNICINSTAEVHLKGKEHLHIGNPIECALLEFAKKNKTNYKYVRKKSQENIVFEYPFTSERKIMSVCVKDGSGFLIYTKGSPAKILSLCDRVLFKDKEIPLDGKIFESLETKIKHLQRQGKIVIAFAYKSVDYQPDWLDERSTERYLVFNGFVGIEQPIRDDAKESVEKCKEAGIMVKMITGDDMETAEAVATQLGLIEEDSILYNVSDVEKMCDEELKKYVNRMVILAGSTPTSKARIVRLLKEKGNSVVAMGESITDIPAVRNADVGVARGAMGTEAIKEVSDLEIMDDSFSSIIGAIKWSRSIYQNFQRILQFQITTSAVAFLWVFLSWILGLTTPFSLIQVILSNILIGGFLSMSMGIDFTGEVILKGSTVKRRSPILTTDLKIGLIANILFEVGFLMLMLKLQVFGGTMQQQRTIMFTTFIFLQICNAFIYRYLGDVNILKNIKSSKMLLIVSGTIILIHMCLTFIGGEIFGFVYIDFMIWLKIAVYSLSILLYNGGVSLVLRRMRG